MPQPWVIANFHCSAPNAAANVSFAHQTLDVSLAQALTDAQTLLPKLNKLMGKGAKVEAIEVSKLTDFGDSLTYPNESESPSTKFPSGIGISLLAHATAADGKVRAVKYVPFPPDVVVNSDYTYNGGAVTVGAQVHAALVTLLESELQNKWGILALKKDATTRVQAYNVTTNVTGTTMEVFTRLPITIAPGDTFKILNGKYVDGSGHDVDPKLFRRTWTCSSVTDDGGGPGKIITVLGTHLPVSVYTTRDAKVQLSVYQVYPIQSFVIWRAVTKKRGQRSYRVHFDGRRK